MIRILHVVTHMNRGGLETMLMNYYRNIDRKQIQFDFLTHRKYEGDFGDEIQALGGRIYHLPTLNPFSRKYKKALSDFLKEHSEYHVIHVHQDCMSSIILKEAKRQNIPIRIAHSHNSSQDKNLKYLVKLFYKSQICKYATHLFACSQDAGKWMFQSDDFIVLNNAIDSKVYSYDLKKRTYIRETLNLTEKTILIGHVGRFCEQKNHIYLIDIFKSVSDIIDAKLLLVGDGPLRSTIENKIRTLNLGDKVILTGVRNDVADLLQAMDVFVFPSLYEGLPVTIIEAQAAGLPCIISKNISIECRKTNLVQQLSLDDSVEAWAKTIIQASKKERCNTCEQIKETGFDIKENVKKLQDFYLRADAGEKNICLY